MANLTIISKARMKSQTIEIAQNRIGVFGALTFHRTVVTNNNDKLQSDHKLSLEGPAVVPLDCSIGH